MTTAASCDPVTGAASFFRNDDDGCCYDDPYYYDDFYYYDDYYYDDCYYYDCY